MRIHCGNLVFTKHKASGEKKRSALYFRKRAGIFISNQYFLVKAFFLPDFARYTSALFPKLKWSAWCASQKKIKWYSWWRCAICLNVPDKKIRYSFAWSPDRKAALTTTRIFRQRYRWSAYYYFGQFRGIPGFITIDCIKLTSYSLLLSCCSHWFECVILYRKVILPGPYRWMANRYGTSISYNYGRMQAIYETYFSGRIKKILNGKTL